MCLSSMSMPVPHPSHPHTHRCGESRVKVGEVVKGGAEGQNSFLHVRSLHIVVFQHHVLLQRLHRIILARPVLLGQQNLSPVRKEERTGLNSAESKSYFYIAPQGKVELRSSGVCVRDILHSRGSLVLQIHHEQDCMLIVQCATLYLK